MSSDSSGSVPPPRSGQPVAPLDWPAAKLWIARRRWYERSRTPWNRVRLHYELARRQAYARGPMHGNVLEMFDEGRLTIGAHTLFEPHVWLVSAWGRISIGEGAFLNLGVMVSAVEQVTIGDYAMIANGCLITDGNHRYDDPDRPVAWQGFTTKGPTTIGDNAWLGANVTVTSGVQIGSRAIIGANSVVTSDIPARTIAGGVPARVIRDITYPTSSGGR
jgi:acetyltransferase-like isoleucine patch superfamily enzyme